MSSMNYPEHGKYEWLPILYDFVVTLKPKRIIEFGPGSGYTTICMAKALKENNIDGHIKSYDIWDDEYWGKQVSKSQHSLHSAFLFGNNLNLGMWVCTIGSNALGLTASGLVHPNSCAKRPPFFRAFD